MQSAAEVKQAIEAGEVRPDLHTRAHTLGLPKSALGRLGLRLQTVLESAVARVSVLPDSAVYDPADFPWVRKFEAGWRTIRAELDQVLAYRDQMPSFHEIIKEVGTITSDDSWKTFFLLGAGMDCSENARRCPQTMQLLRGIPGASTAFFSILSPGKHIPAHRGAYNGVLRFHLGLLVPEPRERCRIRIGNRIQSWNEGEALIFDDSFNHEVWNDTDGWRVVLFVDFARPLRQPWHWLNRSLIGLGPLAPFLREAGQKQKAWEKKFYNKG
ncbi:MAG: aspartyl/asparaginyl beta-hydroxylase domain-containing protein [Nevskia sp.]|nr:aspartyl/asparaginyl beta-hydroxylase domain-containing protein [Nevskia sp.]